MNARDIVLSPRASAVAAALGMLDSAAALAAVQSLCRQPQSTEAVARLTGLAPTGVATLLAELERGGVVRWWTSDAWQLTQLGAELWTVLEPAVRNEQSLRESLHARPF